MADLPKGFVPDKPGGLPAGFVPDEPQSSLSPEDQARLERYRTGAKNTGSYESVRASLDPNQVYLPEPADPVNSALDRFTGGAWGSILNSTAAINRSPLGRKVNSVIGEGSSEHALDQMHHYRAAHPVISETTDLPGYVSGIPGAIASGIERAIPAVTNPLAQAARAIVGSGLTSGLVAGNESAMRGDEPIEVAKETGRGAMGGVAVGAPLSGLSLLMRGGANAILGSKGARAREYLTSRGQPLTAPDTSDAAIGAASQRTDEAVKNAMAGYKQKVASGPYVEALNAVTPEQAGGLIEISDVYHNLSKAAQDPGNLQVADKLGMLVKLLQDRQVATPDGGHAIFMTEEQLNGLRKSLGGIAGVGETTAGKNAPLRAAYDQVKAIVDQGPYAEANRRNAAGMRDLNESLDMVGLDTSTNPDEPIKGNLRVASQRQGQNTVTAGADTERLDVEAFKAKHPELANIIDAPEIIRNQGDLHFRLLPSKSHGGLIERSGSTALAAAGIEGLLHLAAHPHVSPLHLAGAAALGLGAQNLTPIAGRLLYSPAQNAQIAAQMLMQGTPQLAAPGREVIQEGR